MRKDAFARRLQCLQSWRQEAAAVNDRCGKDAPLARRLLVALDMEIAQAVDETVAALATPAERKRAAERALRSAQRNAQTINAPWQHARRRAAYLADRAEQQADRRRAMARAWRALEVSRG